MLSSIRRTLTRLHSALDKLLSPPAKLAPELSPEVEDRIRRDLDRQARRAGTLRWNYARPEALKVPAWLEYFEAKNGSAATLRMIRARAERERGR